MTMIASGKATIARITAERFGCTDPATLLLIERLAASDIVVGPPVMLQGPEPFYTMSGTMDGKKFLLTLSGPAVAAFK
jgi:hypothetical protein